MTSGIYALNQPVTTNGNPLPPTIEKGREGKALKFYGDLPENTTRPGGIVNTSTVDSTPQGQPVGRVDLLLLLLVF